MQQVRSEWQVHVNVHNSMAYSVKYAAYSEEQYYIDTIMCMIYTAHNTNRTSYWIFRIGNLVGRNS